MPAELTLATVLSAAKRYHRQVKVASVVLLAGANWPHLEDGGACNVPEGVLCWHQSLTLLFSVSKTHFSQGCDRLQKHKRPTEILIKMKKGENPRYKQKKTSSREPE